MPVYAVVSLMPTEVSAILTALKEHRQETRDDMHELRGATVRMADALADLGKTMARSEERHSRNEAGMARIGGQLDDHEIRLRGIEHSGCDVLLCRTHTAKLDHIEKQIIRHTAAAAGSWKTIGVVASVAGVVVGLVLTLAKFFIE